MNESQIHLALTHLPVVLSLTGLVILVVAIVIKNDVAIKTSFYILLFAGIFAAPVFFTGEGAEEAVEQLPGISEAIINKHESVATISVIVISISAFLSLIGLIFYNRMKLIRIIKPVLLMTALASASIAMKTAHLGGQIRHTEIRTNYSASETNTKDD